MYMKRILVFKGRGSISYIAYGGQNFYAIRLHKTLLKMTVVYCRNYFIFIRILRVPSRDPGFSLFRGRDSGFLREGGARLVK